MIKTFEEIKLGELISKMGENEDSAFYIYKIGEYELAKYDCFLGKIKQIIVADTDEKKELIVRNYNEAREIGNVTEKDISICKKMKYSEYKKIEKEACAEKVKESYNEEDKTIIVLFTNQI